LWLLHAVGTGFIGRRRQLILVFPSVAEVFAKSLHFAGGGYYDNDGAASAMEFLYEAGTLPVEHPVPILWIEIRYSDDYQ